MSQEVGALRVSLSINTAEFSKSITSINTKLKAMQEEIKASTASGTGFAKGLSELQSKAEILNRSIEVHSQKVAELKRRYDESVATNGENAKATDKAALAYNKAVAEMNKAEQQLKSVTREIEKQQNPLNKLSESLRSSGESYKALGESIGDVGRNLSLSITAPLAALGGLSAKAAMDFESAFTSVRKTVDATEEGFAKLEKGIRDMAKEIPVAATDIAEVAANAGQLGIVEEEILSFTRTIIDLSEATNLTLETGAVEFARFANIVGMSQDNFDRLGSSVVALGNTMPVTESQIVSLAMRLAAQGAQVKMTEAEIMALSATLGSLGLPAEMAGTAMSTILKKMQKAVAESGASLQQFASIAGMSSAEFKAAFETNAIGALDAFVKGLASASAGGANLSAVLADLGMKGIYESDVMLRLAGASDILSEAVETSTREWEKNTALAEEAKQRYETFASQLGKFKNNINDIGITLGSALLPVLNDFMTMLAPLIKAIAILSDGFASLPSFIQKSIISTVALVVAIGPLLMVASSLISGLGTVKIALANLIGPLGTVGATTSLFGRTITLITSPLGKLGSLLSKFPATLGLVSVAVRGLGASLSFLVANPIGATIAAVGLLSTAINFLISLFKKKGTEKLGDEIEESANKASSSLKDFESDAKDSFDTVADESQIAGASIGESIASGVSEGTKKAKDTAISDMREMADKMKKEIDRGTEKINKLGDAIVQALRKQYDGMEKAQTKALDQKVEAEKKASDEIIKQYEKELDERTKVLDKQLEAEKKASDERLKIYDKEQTEKLKLIDEEAYLKVKALQDEIDAIDKKTESEDKAEKKREYQLRVSELKKQIALAETAEEREKLGKDLNKTIADYERQLLLEQRKQQKDNLKSQIDAVKEATNEKKEQLKQEVADKKEAEKEKLEAVQNAIKEEKEATKEKYKELKEKEQERTKTVQDSLNREKEAVKAHFDTLKNEENLRLEARKLIVDQNNKEILRLLKTYNKHWQDAGQSLADSLINGLNSEKQTMQKAIEEAVNLEPIIKSKIAELDKLEQRIKRLEKESGIDTDSSSTVGSNLGGINLGGDFATSTGQIKELEQATVELGEKLAGATAIAQDFGEQLAVTTNGAVNSFLDLNNNVSNVFKEMSWSGKEVTKELASNVTANFDEMKNQVVSRLWEQKGQAEKEMREMLENSTSISEEEKNKLIEIARNSYDEQVKIVTTGHARVAEIWRIASEEKRALTEEEKLEINRIQQEMVDMGIQVLSSSEQEHKVILERMKAEHERIAVEQAAAIVKSSLEQKEKTISTAKAEYVERIKVADKLRAQGTKAASLAADEIIKEAKRQRDQTIRSAEEMHINVVKEAKLQAKEHVDEVNWETGEVLSHWEQHRLKVSKKQEEINQAVSKAWNGIWSEIKRLASNIADYPSQKFEELKNNVKNKFEQIGNFITKPFEDAKEKIFGWIDDIKNFFSNFSIKAPKVEAPRFPQPRINAGNPTNFKVDWYAKGAIFNKPTMFATPYGYKGVGEAGSEAVLPLNAQTLGMIGEKIAETMNTGGGQDINLTVELDGETISRKTLKYMSRELFNRQQRANRGGGR